MKSLLAFYFFVGVALGASLDPSRPQFDSLANRGRIQWDDYKDDIIISQSAEIIDATPAELITRLRNFHKETTLPARASYSKVGKPVSELTVAEIGHLDKAFDEDDAAECTLERCAYKFNEKAETSRLIAAKDRVAEAKHLVLLRLTRFAKTRALLGYEKRDDNIPLAKKSLRLCSFISQRYPKALAFMERHFWKPDSKPTFIPENSYYRSETFAGKGKMQAVFRMTENLEFSENGYLNIELHLYTNHYFDSSLRVYEVFDWPADKKKSVLVVTDFAEIDELKKSNMIRTLFKSRMEEALASFRTEDIKKLR